MISGLYFGSKVVFSSKKDSTEIDTLKQEISTLSKENKKLSMEIGAKIVECNNLQQVHFKFKKEIERLQKIEEAYLNLSS